MVELGDLFRIGGGEVCNFWGMLGCTMTNVMNCHCYLKGVNYGFALLGA